MDREASYCEFEFVGRKKDSCRSNYDDCVVVFRVIVYFNIIKTIIIVNCRHMQKIKKTKYKSMALEIPKNYNKKLQHQ